MATWAELESYIRGNYRTEAGSTDTFIRMIFTLPDGRTQVVMVGRAESVDRAEWMMCSSPIGRIKDINLEMAGRLAFDELCGGIVVINDMVMLHHAAPIENLDVDGFERPLASVVVGADRIEAKLRGVDEF